MKFDHLMHFLETARQQHLTRAAAILRVSPSAVSYSIDCLEEELGVGLFEKRGKRIFLTEAGARLLNKIPEVQRSISDLRSHVSADTPAYQGHYRVGASHLLAENVLAPVAAELFGASNEVTIDIFSLRSAEILVRLLDEQLEVGICFSPQKHPRMRLHLLKEGQLRVYVRAGHPLSKSRDALKRISDFPAAFPKAFGGIEVCETHEVFAMHSITPNVRFAFDHYGVAISLIQNSDAWGFLPDWLESATGFNLVALPLPKNWKAPYEICAAHLTNRFVDAGLDQLLLKLREKFTFHS